MAGFPGDVVFLQEGPGLALSWGGGGVGTTISSADNGEDRVRRLDFTRVFLPESLVQAHVLGFLTPVERLTLNQVRGHAYLPTLRALEGFLLGGRPGFGAAEFELEAGLDPAAEFERGFGSPCRVADLDGAPLARDLQEVPGASCLAVLHLAWLAERHDREAFFEPTVLDPWFRALLARRAEPAPRRARLAAAVLEMWASEASPLRAARAVDAYLDALDQASTWLAAQAGCDLESLEGAAARTFASAERETFLEAQAAAARWAFLGVVLAYPAFRKAVGVLGLAARSRIEARSGMP